jgi:hypothetical protein
MHKETGRYLKKIFDKAREIDILSLFLNQRDFVRDGGMNG